MLKNEKAITNGDTASKKIHLLSIIQKERTQNTISNVVLVYDMIRLVYSRYLFSIAFKAISVVFPYLNGSCKKDGWNIELQIYAIGMEWLNRCYPPKRTERASSPAYGSSVEGPMDLAFGKRFAVAKLTAYIGQASPAKSAVNEKWLLAA